MEGVSQVPHEMTRTEMLAVLSAFVSAAERGAKAGFDWLELHCAHGYLLSGFISPLSNHRQDEFGGSLENRLKFPLEVFAALRKVWVNGEEVPRDHLVSDKDEVAVLPPVSGGI